MRYFIGFLVTIGLLIVLIVLLLTGGGGGSKEAPKTSEKPRTVEQLAQFANTDAVARLTIDGQINANQSHQAVRITVSQSDVTYEQIQGYEGTVVNSQTYASNQSAYNNFLYALGHAGFTRGDDSKLLANEKGFCPLGSRYVFELIQGNSDIERYWATSCNGTKTYKGNVPTTLNLFQLQVPNYTDLTQDLDTL